MSSKIQANFIIHTETLLVPKNDFLLENGVNLNLPEINIIFYYNYYLIFNIILETDLLNKCPLYFT